MKIHNRSIPYYIFAGTLPHEYKVVIAGNHDLTFDEELMGSADNSLRIRFGLDSEKVIYVNLEIEK